MPGPCSAPFVIDARFALVAPPPHSLGGLLQPRPPRPCEEFFSHAPLPMGVLARNGEDARFLQANAASAAQLGKAPSEVSGKSALELGMPPALVQGWLMSLDAVHQLGKPLDVRWQLSTHHGLRTFTSRILPLPDRGSSVLHFGYINQDWTGARDLSVDDAAERERLAGALASALDRKSVVEGK